LSKRVIAEVWTVSGVGGGGMVGAWVGFEWVRGWAGFEWVIGFFVREWGGRGI